MTYRSVLILVAAAFLSIQASAQQWKQVITPSFADFKDVCFVNAQVAYAVGSFGQVAKTTDGGATWSLQTSNSALALAAVTFIDANKGFIVGPSRTIIRTVNGGATWAVDTVREIPETAAALRGIQFINATTGFLLSSETNKSGRVLKTTDGGATWTSVLNVAAEEFYDFAINGTTGVLTGKSVGILYYSTNSGDSWTKIAAAPTLGGNIYTRSDVRAVHLVTPLVGYAVGWGSSIGAQPAIIIKTIDGGKTWTYLPQAPATTLYDNLNSVYFADATNGIAVGGAILKTTDGGATWVRSTFPIGSTLNGINGIGSSALIVGLGGNILSTTDLGVTMVNRTKTPSSTLFTIQFPTATIGYASGFDGLVLKTTDAGKTWTQRYAGANGKISTIQRLQFLDANVGYAACANRSVLKTTDGGTTWQQLLSDTSATTTNTLGVWFLDQTTGFAVGQLKASTDIIYKTTDGGATWSVTSGIALKALRDVAFVSATKGAAVGDGLKILYTTDAGTTWKAATVSGMPASLAAANLRKIEYIDASNAVAIGGKAILRSTDAGATWTYVDSIAAATADMYDIHFSATQPGTGIIVGAKFVMKTVNSGQSWTNIIDTNVVKGTLYSCTYDAAGNMWIGSGTSIVYTTANITAVRQTPSGAPVGFDLAQNYPNPFNPSTQIGFSVPSSQFVTLKVFDLLGREVATLVNEMVNAGSYTARWNPAGHASGVYVCRIQAGAFSASRKLVLQK